MAINVSEINAALEQIEINKGISRERVIESLKESMAKAYRKSLGGDDALVEVNFDLDNGVIEMYQVKNVVKEVEDDLLEISVEDAEEETGKDKDQGDDLKVQSLHNLETGETCDVISGLQKKIRRGIPINQNIKKTKIL